MQFLVQHVPFLLLYENKTFRGPVSSKFVDTASISEKSWGKKKFDWKIESVTLKNRKSKKNFKALWNPKPKKKFLDTVSNLCGTFPIKIWSKLTNQQKFQILKTYPLKILLLVETEWLVTICFFIRSLPLGRWNLLLSVCTVVWHDSVQ